MCVVTAGPDTQQTADCTATAGRGKQESRAPRHRDEGLDVSRDIYWSVRRLKASPTPPCGIFNIIISGRRGLGIQIVVVLLLSCCCCLVLSECQMAAKVNN